MMKVYTTSQIAKYCEVAPQTVCKWFDTGKLKGYRIPGSQDRRIPIRSFISFLSDYGLPRADDLFYEIAVVSQDEGVIEPLERLVRSYSDCCRLTVAKTAFEAGTMISRLGLWCLVLDLDIGSEARQVYDRAVVRSDSRKFNLIQVGSDGSVIQQGKEIPDYFRKPFDPELLFLHIRGLLLDD